MRPGAMLLGVLALAGCSTVRAVGEPHQDRSSVVVVDDHAKGEKDHGRGRFSDSVPPGQYPPAGMCRLWYSGRPPGHQPRAVRCGQLVGRVPMGAMVLYNGKAWDTRRNWRAEESRNPGSVPAVVLRIMNSVDDAKDTHSKKH